MCVFKRGMRNEEPRKKKCELKQQRKTEMEATDAAISTTMPAMKKIAIRFVCKRTIAKHLAGQWYMQINSVLLFPTERQERKTKQKISFFFYNSWYIIYSPPPHPAVVTDEVAVGARFQSILSPHLVLLNIINTWTKAHLTP